MKIFLLGAFAALFTCIAQAGNYQLPTIFQLTDKDCGQIVIAAKTLGTDPDTGYTNGLVYGQTDCSPGGRGAGNTYFAGCYSVQWSGDALVEPIIEVWRRSNRVSIPISDCFGS